MENTENTQLEQTGSTEPDISTSEVSDNQELDNNNEVNLNENSSNQEEQTEAETQTLQEQSSKIKIGEKEYTQEELAELTKQAEVQRQEQEANKYQPRDIKAIEVDYQRETQNFNADLTSLTKQYIAKANDIFNENGEITATAEQLYEHGFKTGDWSYFIGCLNPQDAVNFQNERIGLANHYKNKFEYLEKEGKYISAQQAKQEDLGKWNSYIETNYKDKPAENHFANKLKDGFDFDPEGLKNVMQWFREAIEIEKNGKELSSDNNNAKNALMNTSINNGNNNFNNQKIFTRADIDKMDKAEFSKNEKIIFEQMKKGLIK